MSPGTEPGPEPRSAGAGLARSAAELPVLLVIAAVIAFLVKSLVAQAFFIPSASMEPQLQVHDRVVVSKLAYRLHRPRRGDIVVFDNPTGSPPAPAPLLRRVLVGVGVAQPSTEEYIKRVVALPGERVEAHDGRVFVDGRLLVEPYLPAGVQTSSFAPRVVPPGRLWVMGDNRGNSSDSRVFGPIRAATVVGRTVVKIWPPADASFL